MKNVVVPLVFALCGCEPVEGGPEGAVPSMAGGQSGSEQTLPCVEDRREPVTDPTALPMGAITLPQHHLGVLGATYVGSLVEEGDAIGQVTVTFDADASTLDHVIYVPDASVVDGVDEDCADRYEMAVQMRIEAGAFLDEWVATELDGYDVDGQPVTRVSAGIWARDVMGDVRPETFDLDTAPDPWLYLGFSSGEEVALEVTWLDRPNDDSDTPMATVSHVATVLLTRR